MKTLAEAWSWYRATKENLQRMRRLGGKHWRSLFLEATSIWKDERFKRLEAQEIVEETTASLEPIDDLAIIVLFSVFESNVREYLVEGIKPEADALTDPILKEAAKDAIKGVEEGSFYRRVLDPLSKQDRVLPDLVDQVNQVRNYRNWVAHGRRERDDGMSNVTPRMAYERLTQFLAALGIATEPELEEPEGREMTQLSEVALSDLYPTDETAWLEEMADLIEQGRWSDLDYAHLQEYLTDMARRDRREVESRLVVLLAHLLKWVHQPDQHSRSWSGSIVGQRQELVRLASRGVLRNHSEAVLPEVYAEAVERAIAETGLTAEIFPAACPYTLEQLLSPDLLEE
jgi:hypothetical protein